MSDSLRDLVLIINSRFPLVQVDTSEEVRMMQLLERAASLEDWPLFVWSIADGLRRVPRTDVMPQTYEFQAALRHIDKTPQNGNYVMLDAQPYFEDPVNVRLIKEIAQEYYKTARTLVFIAQDIEIPADLQRMSARFCLPLPDSQEIRERSADDSQAIIEAISARTAHLSNSASISAISAIHYISTEYSTFVIYAGAFGCPIKGSAIAGIMPVTHFQVNPQCLICLEILSIHNRRSHSLLLWQSAIARTLLMASSAWRSRARSPQSWLPNPIRAHGALSVPVARGKLLSLLPWLKQYPLKSITSPRRNAI